MHDMHTQRSDLSRRILYAVEVAALIALMASPLAFVVYSAMRSFVLSLPPLWWGAGLSVLLVPRLAVEAKMRWHRWRADRARREMEAGLSHKLAEALERAGLADLPAQDPRRLALTQRFWLEQRQQALNALHSRFAVAPPAPDLREVLRAQVVMGLGVVVWFVVIFGLIWLVSSAEEAQRSFESVKLPLIVSFVAGSIKLLSDSLTQHIAQREHYEGHLREQRSIAQMGELLGALSLSESHGEDALRGSLESTSDE